MHHSEVIKLVEKFLGDLDSVSAEELQAARHAAWDNYYKTRDSSILVITFGNSKRLAVAVSVNNAIDYAVAAKDSENFDFWTAEAKKEVSEYYKLTSKDKD